MVTGLILCASVWGGSQATLAASPDAVPTDWDIASGGHFYTQTGGTPGKGFSVTDTDGIGFWQEYRRLGGVDALGYPTSQRFEWRGYMNQCFQRAILQWHPDDQRAYPLNVLDLLHDMGKDDWLEARGVPRQIDVAFDAGKDWPQVVADRQGLLDANPAIRERYYSVDNAVAEFGLPTSKVVDLGNCYVVRLQRAVMQQWKTDQPWAKAGQVTVALAGDLAKDAGLIGSTMMWNAGDGTGMLPRWGWQVASGVVPDGERWIAISITDQSVTAMVGSQAVYRAAATTGKSSNPTPEGTFYIYSRVYNETMDSMNAEPPVPHDAPDGYLQKDVFFTQYFLSGGYAIHSNYWQPDSVFGVYPTSHGCAGMRYDDAKFFWDFAEIGTKVVVQK